MKGKISVDGFLKIQRGKVIKYVSCPWRNHEQHADRVYCGDWCPLFGEPELTNYGETELTNYLQFNAGLCERIDLELCNNRVLEFDEFEDER